MSGVTHEDIAVQLKHGEERFTKIEAALKRIEHAVAPVPAMRADIAATKEIVEAWQTAKNAGRFIKWLGGISAAIAALILLAKASASVFFARRPIKGDSRLRDVAQANDRLAGNHFPIWPRSVFLLADVALFTGCVGGPERDGLGRGRRERHGRER